MGNNNAFWKALEAVMNLLGSSWHSGDSVAAVSADAQLVGKTGVSRQANGCRPRMAIRHRSWRLRVNQIQIIHLNIESLVSSEAGMTEMCYRQAPGAGAPSCLSCR